MFLDATKFVLLNVFTLKETICPKNLFKITAEEWKKSTSGWHALLKVKGESSFNKAALKLMAALKLQGCHQK